jgi:hypothetical protein
MRLLICAALQCSLFMSAGCVPVNVNAPDIQNQLKTISAGHTGCPPEENALSDVADRGNTVTWNASCRGKVYLCSGVSDASSARTYSCAPVAQ